MCWCQTLTHVIYQTQFQSKVSVLHRLYNFFICIGEENYQLMQQLMQMLTILDYQNLIEK